MARCQRALNAYLEEKRNAFPRFYFLGDDDLLEILGQSTNPSVIQNHLKKLFQGIHHVQFDEPSGSGSAQTTANLQRRITAMCSIDGERVMLQRPIQLTADVELWLARLANEMKLTLADVLRQCLGESLLDTSRRHRLDPNLYPGQVLALGESIYFARNAETALDSGRLSSLKKDLQVS